MVGWYLRARHQRERYDSVQIKGALLIISRVFNFVNENTGRSLKLRWLRDCLRFAFRRPTVTA